MGQAVSPGRRTYPHLGHIGFRPFFGAIPYPGTGKLKFIPQALHVVAVSGFSVPHFEHRMTILPGACNDYASYLIFHFGFNLRIA